MIASEDGNLKRWAEHFQEVLNCNEDEEDQRDGESVEVNSREGIIIREEKRSRRKITEAIKDLTGNKVPGMDNIAAKMLKANVDLAADVEHHLFE